FTDKHAARMHGADFGPLHAVRKPVIGNELGRCPPLRGKERHELASLAIEHGDSEQRRYRAAEHNRSAPESGCVVVRRWNKCGPVAAAKYRLVAAREKRKRITHAFSDSAKFGNLFEDFSVLTLMAGHVFDVGPSNDAVLVDQKIGAVRIV